LAEKGLRQPANCDYQDPNLAICKIIGLEMSEYEGRVLVTGGAGYIGSHACKALFNAGYQPIAFDSLEYGHSWAAKWGPLEVGNILDTTKLSETIRQYRPIAVMHFAAYAYVGESVSHPLKYYRNNVQGSLSLLDAMRQNDLDMLIFSSSCATYGVPDIVPILETQDQRPINPYGRTKLMVEQILRDASDACGLRSVSLRYFNAAGADPDGMIGEDHEPETHLIPQVIDAALGLRPPVSIFGNDYDTPDGTCIRDYVHVVDLAEAHVLALRYLIEGGKTAAFNLGNGLGASVSEVINTVERVVGRPVPFTIQPRRPGDAPRLVGDVSAAGCLGWRAQRSDLETIVRDAVDWHRRPGRVSPGLNDFAPVEPLTRQPQGPAV
jgi:UDP-arabinose 4-epimerase